jgi:hypothetical protein
MDNAESSREIEAKTERSVFLALSFFAFSSIGCGIFLFGG